MTWFDLVKSDENSSHTMITRNCCFEAADAWEKAIEEKGDPSIKQLKYGHRGYGMPENASEYVRQDSKKFGAITGSINNPMHPCEDFYDVVWTYSQYGDGFGNMVEPRPFIELLAEKTLDDWERCRR
tara:strand:+ start:5205 stop:5585 length:381 start_codon:yes stop_codon:yes gene_type:complete